MVKRRGDKTPEPPSGRAAERLRMFEQARQPDRKETFTSKAPPMEKKPAKKPEGKDENETRRKDR
jgi:hypothetical protein